MKKIFAVVVLYEPEVSVFDNINTYIDFVEKLYIFDNSKNKNISLIKKFEKNKKVLYFFNENNLGLAKVFNEAAKKAIKYKANWLLTMDQDSFFQNKSFYSLCENIDKVDIAKTAILSAQHFCISYNTNKSLSPKNNLIKVETVMSSGNLVNLQLYQKIGPFEENYFIDYIDNEYCLRANKKGYDILVDKNSLLIHKLGDIKKTKFLNKIIHYSNHNYIRRYYITRNRLDVISKYKKTFPVYCKNIIKVIFVEWLKILLFEKQKLKKNIAIIIAFIDFTRGNFGKKNFKFL